MFAVLWAKHFGLEVDYELLRDNAEYVRNALVWGSQGIYSRFEYLDRIFMDAILHSKQEIQPQNEESHGRYEKIGDYRVKDYQEQPHRYVEEKN